MIGLGKSAGLASAGLALAFALSACDDSATKRKAAEEAKAKAEAAETADKLRKGVAHNVECLSALRWQRAALTQANVGDLKLYEDFYRGQLDQVLGSEILPKGDDGSPTLSRANTHDYIEWAYPVNVETKFRAGKDGNGDGTLSATERSGRGFNIVTGCIQRAAEMGQGPLAKMEKLDRVSRMDGIRRQLRDKGA